MVWYKITGWCLYLPIIGKLAHCKFLRNLVCDYIGLKNVISKMSGLVQNLTLEEFE